MCWRVSHTLARRGGLVGRRAKSTSRNCVSADECCQHGLALAALCRHDLRRRNHSRPGRADPVLCAPVRRRPSTSTCRGSIRPRRSRVRRAGPSASRRSHCPYSTSFWAVADSDSDGHAPAQAQPHERAVIGLVEDGSPRGLRSESPEEARTRRRLRTAAP